MESIAELGYPEPMSDLPVTAIAGSALCTSANPMQRRRLFYTEAAANGAQEHVWAYDELMNAWLKLVDPTMTGTEAFANGVALAYDEKNNRLWRFASDTAADYATLIWLDVTAAVPAWTAVATTNMGLASAWTTDARMVYNPFDHKLYIMGNGAKAIHVYDILNGTWAQKTGVGAARAAIPAAGATLDMMYGTLSSTGGDTLVSQRGGGSAVWDTLTISTDTWAVYAIQDQFAITKGESVAHPLLPGVLIVRAEGHRLYAVVAPLKSGSVVYITPIGDTYPGAPSSAHIGNGIAVYPDESGRLYVATRNHADVLFQRSRLNAAGIWTRG